jgi:hypothetical protein
MSKILIVNNFKGDEESEKLKDFKKYAGISGHELCPVFRKFKREEVIDMLTNPERLDILRLFLWSLLDSLNDCDKLYIASSSESCLEDLSQLVISMYLANRCPPEIVMVGDIQKILNHFIITEEALNDSDYEFISHAIILSQCFINFNKNGGATDSNMDYTKGASTLVYCSSNISQLDILSLKKNLDTEFEEFDLNNPMIKENPLTIRSDNFLIYDEHNYKLINTWLFILFSHNLSSDFGIWILNLLDNSTNLMKLLSNDIIDLERSKFGLRVKKMVETHEDLEVAQEINESEESLSQ